MQKEIIVNSSPNEVRVALLEDREVVEFFMERAESRRAVGNVYKGVVTAVRPGLQAAFVEIGMEKAGFLHVSDLIHDDPEDDDDGGRGGRRRRRGRREGMRPIETMLKEGDELLVQVTKEIIGTKGPRLTADVSLPGRFMVLMPKGDHVGVSRKIEDRKERHRLRDLLSSMKPEDEGGAFIIRTAAIGIEPKALQRDMEYLRDLWKEIQSSAHTTQAPAVVHQDVGLLIGMIRDIFKDDIDGLVIDSRDEYNELMQHVRNFSPELRERIRLYEGDVPLFDKFGVEQELKKSLERKVWMKRGGFLVMDEAEALVAIDVNTGRYTGRKNQAETIFKTNMLAAREIARQLRLRDVGGIIVCDFIDMESEDDKRKVLNELRTHLKRDRARTKTFPVTDLGLVEMSRQRVQQSLKDRLSDDCPYCGGGGQVLSTDTLANKVERLLLKLAATRDEKAVQVRANPTLALVLMTDRANGIQNIARSTGIRVDVVDDPRLHREQFQIVSVHRRKDLVAEIEKAASDGRESGQQAQQAEPRRRPARQEEPAERSERGGRGERSDRGERGGQRRRRRRDEEGGERSQERRPARNASEEQSGERERPSRRRREESRERPPRERPAAAPAEEAAVTTAPAGRQDHPAEDDDGSRRRRRRRGRRGGRGRRRRGEGEGDEQTQQKSEAAAEAPETTAPVREERPADTRPPRREDRPADPRPPRREEPVFHEEPAPEPVEQPARAEAAESDPDGDEPQRRRRRRRRPARGAGGGATESPAPQERPAREEAAAPVEAAVPEPTPEPAPAPVPVAAEPEAPRREERRLRRPRPERTEPAPRAAAASRESYVKPVPEDEWMEKRRALEAESVTQESMAPTAEPAQPEPPRAEATQATQPTQPKEATENRARRPRRRSRRAGTPTRLIGTGKVSRDDD